MEVTKGKWMTPGALARLFQRLFGALSAAPAPKREEYVRRVPTQRKRRGSKGNAGARAKRVARGRRRNVIAKASRRRNRA